jgi:hypothetical protein
MLVARRFVSVATLIVISATIAFPSTPRLVRVTFAHADLDDVLYFYSHLSGKPVYVDAGVGGIVDIMSQGDITGPAALAWIRRQLLERCGIEIRETPESEIHVSWSTDHDQAREAAKASLKTVPPARVIDIATLRAKKPH